MVYCLMLSLAVFFPANLPSRTFVGGPSIALCSTNNLINPYPHLAGLRESHFLICNPDQSRWHLSLNFSRECGNVPCQIDVRVGSSARELVTSKPLTLPA